MITAVVAEDAREEGREEAIAEMIAAAAAASEAKANGKVEPMGVADGKKGENGEEIPHEEAGFRQSAKNIAPRLLPIGLVASKSPYSFFLLCL